MKATFTTDDAYEIKQIAKANHMAIMLWELYHNNLKKMTLEDKEIILNLLEEHNINVNDLTY